jgi:nucleoside-triphosphatase THEP1
MAFQKAVRKAAKLRIGIAGPSGSGKTYTALRLAHLLGEKVAVIDTERGSASLYQGERPDERAFDFDVLELHSFEPVKYTDAIRDAVKAGYDVLVIDSLSHAWNGVGGMLEQVDRAAASSQSKDTFGAWRNVTPQHNKLVDAILTSPIHVIFCLRTKTEYVIEKNEKGKNVPRKVGITPIFRDGIEYESTVFFDIDTDHNVTVSKTRCAPLDGKMFHKPGPDIADALKDWLAGGAPVVNSTPEPAAEVEHAEHAEPSPEDKLAENGWNTIQIDDWRKSRNLPLWGDMDGAMRAKLVSMLTDPQSAARKAFDDHLAKMRGTTSGHHPSFTDAERKRFMAKLTQIGLKYDDVKAFTIAMSPSHTAPSAWTPTERDLLLNKLERGGGKEEVEAWLFDNKTEPGSQG